MECIKNTLKIFKTDTLYSSWKAQYLDSVEQNFQVANVGWIFNLHSEMLGIISKFKLRLLPETGPWGLPCGISSVEDLLWAKKLGSLRWKISKLQEVTALKEELTIIQVL